MATENNIEPPSESANTKMEVKQENGKSEKGQDPSQPAGEAKLSGAELKKRKQAEKAAKRAAAKEEKGEAPTSHAKPQRPAGKPEKSSQAPQPKQQAQKNLPTRSTQAPPGASGAPPAPTTPARYPTFHFTPLCPLDPPAHHPKHTAALPPPPSSTETSYPPLYAPPPPPPLGSTASIHPTIQTLAAQQRALQPTGSTARTLATLSALRAVIAGYATPAGTSLPRHLPAHLTAQLAHLARAGRPLPVATDAAAAWLKRRAHDVDVAAPEPQAKAALLAAVDDFVRERFTAAAQAIAASAAARIADGDRVATFGASAVVLATLRLAHRQGKRVRVVVLDARPLREGRRTVAALAREGIRVSYHPGPGAHAALRGAKLVLLGAHAVLGTGAVYARAGTAGVALAARARGVAVLACAESVKLTERAPLDALANELADPAELVRGDKGLEALGRWERDAVLNVRYDVTPPEYVSAVVTEVGVFPPRAASGVCAMGQEA